MAAKRWRPKRAGSEELSFLFPESTELSFEAHTTASPCPDPVETQVAGGPWLCGLRVAADCQPQAPGSPPLGGQRVCCQLPLCLCKQSGQGTARPDSAGGFVSLGLAGRPRAGSGAWPTQLRARWELCLTAWNPQCPTNCFPASGAQAILKGLWQHFQAGPFGSPCLAAQKHHQLRQSPQRTSTLSFLDLPAMSFLKLNRPS